MAREERNGKRKLRDQQSKREPRLGYYGIVTDTRETEKNYFNGLRDSMPKGLEGKIVIKVTNTDTKNLVREANKVVSLHPQYCEPWIVFDRDQVVDFDKIVYDAENTGVNVGWSNPCIETWFSAYFGGMPDTCDSTSCCSKFRKTFFKNVGQDYTKADKAVYLKLTTFGNEEKAVKLAEQRYRTALEKSGYIPSKMSPCSTVFMLIKDIRARVSGA